MWKKEINAKNGIKLWLFMSPHFARGLVKLIAALLVGPDELASWLDGWRICKSFHSIPNS